MLPPIPPILAPMLQESARPAGEAADAAARDAREEALRAVAGAVPDATREAAAQAPAADTASRLEELARAAAEAAALDAGQSDGDEAGETDEDARARAARETRERIERVRKEAKAAREEAEAARAAADELRDLLAELRAEADAQALRLGRLRERVAEAERFGDSMRVSGALDKLAALDEGGGGDGGGGSGSPPWPETVGTEGAGFENPHAFQVIVGSGGEVCVYVPKSNDEIDNRYFGGAYGGAHLGNESNRIAPSDAGPFTREGVWGSAPNPPEGVDCNWAHFGWLQVGSVTPDSSTQDKMVVAEFMVPRDPPEEERDDDTEVQGPQLTGFSFIDATAWKEIAKQTWKQFDPSGSSPVPRKVPIALVANGSVTQLTMTPFLSLGGGTDEPWHPDSECGKFLSLDPPNEKACPDYETEEYQETEQREVGKDLNGNPIMRDVTLTKTRVKTDPQTGEPIQKTDGSGNPMFLAPKHQVHNFETGDDGAEIQPVDEDGYPKDLVACRVKKAGGGYELMWRKLPPYKEPCPPPDVTASVRYESGGDTVYLDITVTPYVKNQSTGECEPGTPTVTTVPIPSERVQIDCDCKDGCSPEVTVEPANPNPLTNGNGPTLAATVTVVNKHRDANGDCVSESQQVYRVYNGKDGKDGCTPVVNVIALNPNPPTQKGHATKAGTIEVTPCNGAKQTLDVYNGQDGEDGEDGRDGCSPVVTPGAGHTDADGRVLACKIQGRKLGANGCENDGNEIEVYNGLDGHDGCTPVVAEASGTVDGRTKAFTIQPKKWDAQQKTCVDDGGPITVFNGKDATVCGSFYGFAGVKFESGVLKYGKQLYEFQLDNGCYKPVATGSVVWDTVAGLTFQPCPN